MNGFDITGTGANPAHVGTLARNYDRMLKAIDDDGVADQAAVRFAAWLAEWWRPDGPPEPAVPPDAVSTDRHGIMLARWYTTPDSVRAYLPGARGCYRIPRFAPIPIVV
jgi:hypothetical protein